MPQSAAAQIIPMVAAAFFIRLLFVAVVAHSLPNPAGNFEQFGWEMGWVSRSIAMGRGFSSPFFPPTGPTALVPPMFPYLLAAIFRIFGVYSLLSGVAILSLNALFSALTCIPIYLIARRATGARCARLAGWAWVIYPFSIYYSTQVWDYALTALLFTTCLCILQRLHATQRGLVWIGFGALCGFTALCNPSVLTILPLLFLAVLVKRFGAGSPWLLEAALATAAMLAVLAPWTIRNYRVMHVPAPVRDNYWLELWAGNTGDTFESNPAWTHPASDPDQMRQFQSLGETAYLATKRQMALNFVAHRPLFFAELSLRRAFRFWTGFWSFDARYLKKESLDVPNLFFCSGVTFFMLRGARRLWRRDRLVALPFLALLALFPVTYYLSHSSMDYRQPVEPEIIILVSMGILGPGRPIIRTGDIR